MHGTSSELLVLQMWQKLLKMVTGSDDKKAGANRGNKVKEKSLGIRVVCISDTHGRHRDCEIPNGDVLIHAGDFTRYGKRADADDFNKWLGELPHRHKIVVNGTRSPHVCPQKTIPS